MLITSVLLATLPSALPQDESAPRSLLLHTAGVERILAHPKDRGLLEVWRLLDARLAELPEEFPDLEIPPQVLTLAKRILGSSMTLRISPDTSGLYEVPFSGQLELHTGSEEGANSLAAHVLSFLSGLGMPSTEAGENGLSAVPDIPMPAWFGPAGKDWIFALGKLEAEPVDMSAFALPGDMETLIAFEYDYAGTLRALGPMLSAQMGEAEFAEMQKGLALSGADQLTMRFSSGRTATRAWSVTNMPGYAKIAAKFGMSADSQISESALRAVPEDALWAVLGVNNPSAMLDYILEVAEQPLADAGIDANPLQMIEEAIGINLRTDLFEHLGQNSGIYASDTTGGSGLYSMAAFFELSNKEDMQETCAILEQLINGIGQSEAQGYVQARKWTDGATTYTTLAFPGLPIPLEPTFAIVGDYLVAGLSAQAALGAVHQITDSATSLLDNDNFKQQFAGPMDGVLRLTFFDSPRMLRDGYGPMAMISSALANGVRSRIDTERNPGLVMPPFHALVDGAMANVQITRVAGDDVIVLSIGDPSVMVNATAAVGFLSSGPWLALGLGIAGFTGFAETSTASIEAWDEF